VAVGGPVAWWPGHSSRLAESGRLVRRMSHPVDPAYCLNFCYLAFSHLWMDDLFVARSGISLLRLSDRSARSSSAEEPLSPLVRRNENRSSFLAHDWKAIDN
jgi:hypothetical protein